MSELLRGTTATEGTSDELDAAGREARIEQLLLSGLDQYFSGRYEQAIDIWTRVAFLERRHGRARAYIERARSALAERQRESDELLHRGVAAFQDGRLDDARGLLSQAVEQGGPSDAALALLERLRRVEPTTGPPGAFAPSTPPVPSTDSPRAGRGRPGWAQTILGSLSVVAIVTAVASPVTSFLAEWPVGGVVGPAPTPRDPLPLPEPSEGLVRRARALHAAGRSREALRLLETVRPGDPLRVEVDAFRAEVERLLLGAVGGPGADGPAATSAVEGAR